MSLADLWCLSLSHTSNPLRSRWFPVIYSELVMYICTKHYVVFRYPINLVFTSISMSMFSQSVWGADMFWFVGQCSVYKKKKTPRYGKIYCCRYNLFKIVCTVPETHNSSQVVSVASGNALLKDHVFIIHGIMLQARFKENNLTSSVW